MTELTTATEVTYSDDDYLPIREGGTAGLRKAVLSNLATYFRTKIFGAFVGQAGNVPMVNATEDGFILVAPSYRLGFSLEVTAPVGNEVVLRHVFVFPVAFPDDFANSRARLSPGGGNPATNQVFTISVNGSAVGTLTISTLGVITFATTAGALTVAAGDEFKVEAPAAPDAALIGVSVTFLGAE